jgi:hypothetical protein
VQKFKLAPLKLHNSFENPSSNLLCFKDPKEAILTLKMLTGSRL